MILISEAQADTKCAIIIKYDWRKTWAEKRRGSFNKGLGGGARGVGWGRKAFKVGGFSFSTSLAKIVLSTIFRFLF